jgi:transcriptional regulator with XRE-family HTH domain
LRDVRELHEEWMRDQAYRAEYEALEPEFELAWALMAARLKAGLSQEQVAQRMKTSQPVAARLEAGRTRLSTKTLQRFAEATGMRLRLSFELAVAGAAAE